MGGKNFDLVVSICLLGYVSLLACSRSRETNTTKFQTNKSNAISVNFLFVVKVDSFVILCFYFIYCPFNCCRYILTQITLQLLLLVLAIAE